MNISLKDLAENFGCNKKEFSKTFIDFYNSLDMTYQVLTKESRDRVILEILNKLDTDTQIIGAPERTDVWSRGWKENLDEFVATGDLQKIVPKFIRPGMIVRYNGDFIKPNNPHFERDFVKLFQIYCYDTFIHKNCIKNVYEFGCGSSFNLMAMAELSMLSKTEIEFHGSDFVESSVELCNKLGEFYNINLSGFYFDMINPNNSIKIKENSAIYTFGAIEQLKGQFEDFILFLIKNKPRICFHVEPTIENYDSSSLFDYLQIKFHAKRGYSQGLLPYLKKLEEDNHIKIIQEKRINFGSKFMEGYHLFVWETK